MSEILSARKHAHNGGHPSTAGESIKSVEKGALIEAASISIEGDCTRR